MLPARDPFRTIATTQDNPSRLRALTYLSPGIPREFFELVTRHLAEVLRCEVTLETEPRSSGPMHGADDPFAEGDADIGFLCSPSYLYLRSQAEPSVELVPAAFVFADERHDGEPVTFSEVVVRANHPARTFVDLAGGTWGFNDECSLSGYFSTLQELSRLDSDQHFFERWVQTGSHFASVEAVIAGDIDGAAIDSVVLSLLHRARPQLRDELRIVDSFGPFPIQPVVVRAAIAPAWRTRIARALIEFGPRSVPALSAFDFDGCIPISDDAYHAERDALCALGRLCSGTDSPSSS